MTRFFLPDIDPDAAEARYAELAAALDLAAALPAERIASVEYVHNSEDWTAAVGARLSGSREESSGRRMSRQSFAPRPPRVRQFSDLATVQAIFEAGWFYLILTDQAPMGAVRGSAWENPFMIGRDDVRRVHRFVG